MLSSSKTKYEVNMTFLTNNMKSAHQSISFKCNRASVNISCRRDATNPGGRASLSIILYKTKLYNWIMFYGENLFWFSP